ncbi:hypothetical protein KAR91_02275 [Candidatus Pacearchaeota archaeon]|nr:hypothetical protein [Candidatus Pacearchaeota archaeon]
MTFFTILKIISYIAAAGIPSFLFIKNRVKLKKEHKQELENSHHELAEEIRRNQEREKQVTDLLEFQSNDKQIEKDMYKTAEILVKAKDKKDVKKGFKKVSASVRDIYRNREL